MATALKGLFTLLQLGVAVASNKTYFQFNESIDNFEFGTILWNRRLAGGTLERFYNLSILQCVSLCMNRQCCESVSFSSSLYVCDLHEQNNISEVTGATGYVYSHIATWPKIKSAQLPVMNCTHDKEQNTSKPTTQRNIAFGKVASQSSDYEDWTADRAVDGRTEEPYCSHTDLGDKARWWMVDLAGEFIVSKVFIVNRQFRNERLRNIGVYFGKTREHLLKCGSYDGPGGSAEEVEIDWVCNEVGRYLQIEGGEGYSNDMGLKFLQLCEVIVIGIESD